MRDAPRARLAAYHPGVASPGVPVPRTVPRHLSLPNAVVVLTGLAMTAGVIHVVAVIEHVSVSWMLGVFFGLVGAGQLLAAWWIYHKPGDRRMMKAAAIGSGVVALLWVFSRTTGLPFGPDAGEVASVGVADTIATLQEVAFATIVAALVWRPGRGEQRMAWLSSGLGIRFTFAVLSATLLLAAMGGHEH